MGQEYHVKLTKDAGIALNFMLRSLTLKGRSDTRMQAKLLREIKANLFEVLQRETDDKSETGRWREGTIKLEESVFKFFKSRVEDTLDSGKPELPGNFAIGAAEILDAIDAAKDKPVNTEPAPSIQAVQAVQAAPAEAAK